MLVGSGMEDIIRTIFLEYTLHSFFVSYGRHEIFSLYIAPLALHLQLEVVHGCLCLVYKNKGSRRV